LKKELNINIFESIYFGRLSPSSYAHKYAGLMRGDSRNKLDTYIKIKLNDFEKWLK